MLIAATAALVLALAWALVATLAAVPRRVAPEEWRLAQGCRTQAEAEAVLGSPGRRLVVWRDPTRPGYTVIHQDDTGKVSMPDEYGVGSESEYRVWYGTDGGTHILHLRRGLVYGVISASGNRRGFFERVRARLGL